MFLRYIYIDHIYIFIYMCIIYIYIHRCLPICLYKKWDLMGLRRSYCTSSKAPGACMHFYHSLKVPTGAAVPPPGGSTLQGFSPPESAMPL